MVAREKRRSIDTIGMDSTSEPLSAEPKAEEVTMSTSGQATAPDEERTPIRPRVLIVDDDPLMHRVLQAELARDI